MPLKVRSATLQDEEAVIALWQACGLVSPPNDPAVDFRFAKAGPASDVLLGADEMGRVQASVMVGHDGHRGWLYYVASSPELRGAGAGRHMIEAAEDWLRRRGVWKIQLMVRETNARVVSFYRHLGFETAPRIVMSKRLDQVP